MYDRLCDLLSLAEEIQGEQGLPYNEALNEALTLWRELEFNTDTTYDLVIVN